LANFSKSDLTWWTLFDCYRDSDGRVSTAARYILHTLSNHKNIKVNWAPVTSSIRHILDGTNLFALRQAVEVLVKTDISSDLCIPLLKDGGTLLLALLGADRESDKKLAHQLLMKLSRKNFDRDSAEWENWLRRL
jgi:hypothetical protein